MKNFSSKFEDHKIPEWYDRYFDYAEMKNILKEFKENPKSEKLSGFFNY
jgi:SPX domain protein involved in polyphosphate accumulation